MSISLIQINPEGAENQANCECLPNRGKGQNKSFVPAARTFGQIKMNMKSGGR